MNLDLRTIRVATAYTRVHIGNAHKNAEEIQHRLGSLSQADVVVFPELCLTGYTCADLFQQSQLIDDAFDAAQTLAKRVARQIVIVGLPFLAEQTLYSCAAVMNQGRIVGLVPKSFLPNYKEFYEARWFHPAPHDGSLKSVQPRGCEMPIPFGTDLLFQSEQDPNFIIGVEICEDLWAPIPPSSFQAIAGATLLVNLSASNELVAKADYRRHLVEQQSGRSIAAYAYCSSGPTESTTDLVFGGHCLIADNGALVAETARFEVADELTAEIDIERLVNERRRTPTFNHSKRHITREFRKIAVQHESSRNQSPLRALPAHPFVPAGAGVLKSRCAEIFHIQTCALAKRLESVGSRRFVIGVSGGLDSTLALLVAAKAVKRIGLDSSCIDAVTMPGFGTSEQTLANAKKLMDLLATSHSEIDIRPACLQVFQDLNHKPFGLSLEGLPPNEMTQRLGQLPAGANDLVFENVQARVRTLLLMSRGFVLGTGDLSEAALGWSTYNGDHMSMYNVNASIPKTLVRFLVNYVAEHEADDAVKVVLKSILSTVISPELLPLGQQGEIVHATEDAIGPYELHDFFLFHFVRNNFESRKIALLAKSAFAEKYTCEEIQKWLRVFFTRFFRAQFKRSCTPDGPKVGSVSLSPRGDWRMPSDADPACWIHEDDAEPRRQP